MVAYWYWPTSFHPLLPKADQLWKQLNVCKLKWFCLACQTYTDPTHCLHFQASLSWLMASHSPGECGHKNFINLENYQLGTWKANCELDIGIYGFFSLPLYIRLSGEQVKALLKFMPRHSECVAGRRKRQPLCSKT